MLLVFVMTGTAAAPHARDYGRATLVVIEGILGVEGPLSWWTADPQIGTLRWDGGLGELTLPSGNGRVPAVVVVLGADPAPPDDPRVRRLTSTLARLDVAVLIPLSDALISAHVEPDGVTQLVRAVEALRSHPRIRGRPVGLVGLSTGGSLALVAAADDRVVTELPFVLAIGPYWDAGHLVAAIASQSTRRPDGEIEAWIPHSTATEIVRNTLALRLPERDVDALLAPAPYAEAEARVESLLRAEAEFLDQISPVAVASGLTAPIYLMHDRGDEYIPWTESEAMAASLGPVVYHRVDLLQHVEPAVDSLPVVLRDSWRLIRVIADMLDALS